ncbi:tRNA uridine(34) 5-carboxymethylaminomethyl modification radical SAM/GNAT enzyme Elp3 [Patescibacteria group bacterium]|nr:tRNA uridine(34) 5-carboxymethylaminomethyl modification radical SAM/GNAT enzyme Elp3 [Patescibacteria group bacterium]
MAKQTRPPEPLVDALIATLRAEPTVTSQRLDEIIRTVLRGTTHRFPRIPELVFAYRKTIPTEGRHLPLERLLRCKTVRTDSGVAPITLLTKPYACPGKCVYCPTEVRMPKSYVASEPAAARALYLKFDPYQQVAKRVEALEVNGHEAKKIELIIKGGTWSAYPWDYRKWFVKRCFDAANHLSQGKKVRYASLAASQKANEQTEYCIIGLTIETRPDWINPKEILRLRELGCTRVELGVQALDDEILALTKRGHDVAATVRATTLLKAAGFKTDYHFLPGQPGSSADKDVAMFSQLFDDPRFRPDMVKIYPCVVLPSAELADWYKEGKFVPLEGDALVEAMIKMKTRIPYYCRISRLIRDFPSTEISGGNLVTNLRDVIKLRMKERGLSCKCLRCREAGHRPTLAPDTKPELMDEIYENAGGEEHFLSIEDPARTTVLAFLRLRLPELGYVDADPKTQRMLTEIRAGLPELEGAAFVRELHTYGQALRIRDDQGGAVQHKGLGRQLMLDAERIARDKGYKTMAVISGIGVRQYYRDLGYELRGTYMCKDLS